MAGQSAQGLAFCVLGAALTAASCGSRTGLADRAGSTATGSGGGRGESASEEAGAYSPSSLGDRLVLWLDATKGLMAAGAVTIWADQSGYGNNAINLDANAGVTPSVEVSAINGLPAVQFSADTDLLTVRDATSLHFGTEDLITCAVLKHHSELASESRIVVSKQSFDSPYVGLGLFVNHLGTYDSAAQLIYRQLAATYSPGISFADNRPRLYVFHRAGGHLELRINGASVASTSATRGGADVDLTNTTDVRIGGQDAFQALQGSICEIMIVRSTVTPGELSDLEKYLIAKYQLI